MRKKDPNKPPRAIWVIRLEPELYLAIKKRGKGAAAWVRSLIRESLEKQ